MTSLDIINIIKTFADNYRVDASKSIIRNCHMHNYKTIGEIEQDLIDAVLVDFINYMAFKHGIDYGLYSSDLKSK